MTTSTTKQIEYPLSPEERAPVDEISAQIVALTQQRTGMILLLSRLKGISHSAIDYVDGKIIATPQGETK